FAVRSYATLPDERPPTKDAQQYLTIAHNIVHRGAFSLSQETPQSDGAPSPTMHRAPVYPLLRSLTLSENQQLLRPLRPASLRLGPMHGLLAMALAWALTRSRWRALLTLGLVGLDGELMAMSGNLLSENVACLLMIALSLCLAIAVRTLRGRLFALTGLLLG